MLLKKYKPHLFQENFSDHESETLPSLITYVTHYHLTCHYLDTWDKVHIWFELVFLNVFSRRYVTHGKCVKFVLVYKYLLNKLMKTRLGKKVNFKQTVNTKVKLESGKNQRKVSILIKLCNSNVVKKQRQLHLWLLTLNIPAHMFWYAWLIVISRLKGRTIIKKKIIHSFPPPLALPQKKI